MNPLDNQSIEADENQLAVWPIRRRRRRESPGFWLQVLGGSLVFHGLVLTIALPLVNRVSASQSEAIAPVEFVELAESPAPADLTPEPAPEVTESAPVAEPSSALQPEPQPELQPEPQPPPEPPAAIAFEPSPAPIPTPIPAPTPEPTVLPSVIASAPSPPAEVATAPEPDSLPLPFPSPIFSTPEPISTPQASPEPLAETPLPEDLTSEQSTAEQPAAEQPAAEQPAPEQAEPIAPESTATDPTDDSLNQQPQTAADPDPIAPDAIARATPAPEPGLQTTRIDTPVPDVSGTVAAAPSSADTENLDQAPAEAPAPAGVRISLNSASQAPIAATDDRPDENLETLEIAQPLSDSATIVPDPASSTCQITPGALNQAGTAIALRVRTDQQGQAVDVSVEQSSGNSEYDQLAACLVKTQWSFEPATLLNQQTQQREPIGNDRLLLNVTLTPN
jgi:TonB family protein